MPLRTSLCLFGHVSSYQLLSSSDRNCEVILTVRFDFFGCIHVLCETVSVDSMSHCLYLILAHFKWVNWVEKTANFTDDVAQFISSLSRERDFKYFRVVLVKTVLCWCVVIFGKDLSLSQWSSSNIWQFENILWDIFYFSNCWGSSYSFLTIFSFHPCPSISSFFTFQSFDPIFTTNCSKCINFFLRS